MLSNSDAVTEQKLMNKITSKSWRQGERQQDANESSSQQETSFAQNDKQILLLLWIEGPSIFWLLKERQSPQRSMVREQDAQSRTTVDIDWWSTA